MKTKKMTLRFWADDSDLHSVIQLVVNGIIDISEDTSHRQFCFEGGGLKVKMVSCDLDLNLSNPDWYEYFTVHYENGSLEVKPLKSERIIMDMPVEFKD
jgi:hypothetical protein